jgi:tight adherence protein C
MAGILYRFGPRGLAQQVRSRLVLAGLSDRLDPDTFLALSAAFPVAVAGALYLYSQLSPVPPVGWLLLVLGSAALPKIWLTNKVETRQREIRLALADTLDLMTIAVEAGLGFDSALARVVSAIPGPLSDELYRLLQEIRIGIRRQDALNGLSERTRVSELDQFITAINQADVFGISVGQVLRIQAAQLRQKRSQMAEERANKTPVKLLFPLILCIFPALFTVLVGPAAIAIMDNLLGNL